ncbi:hypothetical protein CHU98_g10669 [Xylaria longipes]|nr:hypothetical protein CHU98_g10669 [Xylaria longipes]
MASFTCHSCTQQCDLPSIGSDPLENQHLRELDHPLAPLASPFPIWDTNQKIHLIRLDKELVEALQIPHAPQKAKSLFECFQHLFWRRHIGAAYFKSWLHYDQARASVKFQVIDNLHLLAAALSSWKGITYTPAGLLSACILKLHALQNGQRVTFTLYYRIRTREVYDFLRAAESTKARKIAIREAKKKAKQDKTEYTEPAKINPVLTYTDAKLLPTPDIIVKKKNIEPKYTTANFPVDKLFFIAYEVATYVIRRVLATKSKLSVRLVDNWELTVYINER